MRRAFLILIFTSISFLGFSQQDFRRFAVGAGGGITTNNSDLQTAVQENMLWAGADLYFTKFISSGAEVQVGKLSGKENRPENRFFENHYKSVTLYGKLHLGQFTLNTSRYRFNDDSFLDRLVKGIYLGSGGGVLVSRQQRINRGEAKPPEYPYMGLNQNKEIFIPLMAGIDVPTSNKPTIILSVHYQLNFLLGDNMDGYLVGGSRNDIFSSLAIGVKFAFGRLQLSQ